MTKKGNSYCKIKERSSSFIEYILITLNIKLVLIYNFPKVKQKKFRISESCENIISIIDYARKEQFYIFKELEYSRSSCAVQAKSSFNTSS